MKKKRRMNKEKGVLIRLEEVIDVLNAIRHSMWTEEQASIEYMKKGIIPLARLHYKQLKELHEAYRTVYGASCTFGSWRRVGWFER